MKNTILFILCIISFECTAQKKASTFQYPSPFAFSAIDSTAGTKEELFVKANEWVVKTFVSAKDVIQMSDKSAGKIIAKGVIDYTENGMLATTVYYVRFTLSIDVKDNKYRIKLFDFSVEETIANGGSSNSKIYSSNCSLDGDGCSTAWPKVWNRIRNQCLTQSQANMISFNQAMKTKVNDNW